MMMNRRELLTGTAAVAAATILPAVPAMSGAISLRDMPINISFSKDALHNELIVWYVLNPTKKYYVSQDNVTLLGVKSMEHWVSFGLKDTEYVCGTFWMKQSEWDAFREHKMTFRVYTMKDIEKLDKRNQEA